ncbi:hypothetical protein FBU30_001100 [Linnemannia zychae]|nr:hypothetical protein FBU30_001100 [Linnemannia zychae]
MKDTSLQEHGDNDLTGTSKDQQIDGAQSIDVNNTHVITVAVADNSKDGNERSEQQTAEETTKLPADTSDSKQRHQQQTLGEGGIHQGSKRHKESKHGHYQGEQPAKKQKKHLRKIQPYYFKYQTYAKGRWLGRKLIEVFNTEFRDRDNTFYERAIKDGRVKINGEVVDKDYIVRNSDIVSHDIHRHEPPVANLPVKVVKSVDGVIIVDKPSSIPVHPSGRYRHNTVLHILMTEQGYKELYRKLLKKYQLLANISRSSMIYTTNIHTIVDALAAVNRLDRLTSGLMIIALSVKKAREFEKMMQKCEIKKEYVCMVKGEFPSGVTECHQPIHVASFKLTLNTVHPDGKPCSTIFERLRYDAESNTSIVLARPVTGRTHQIRVHLQWLGHPITNDPLYHNQEIWGENNGQGGITDEAEKELVKKLLAQTEAEDELDYALATSSLNNPNTGAANNVLSGQKSEFCSICNLPSRLDPVPEKRIMYLHAWRYQAKDWSFETELPDWARDTVLATTTATTDSCSSLPSSQGANNSSNISISNVSIA